MGYKKAKQLENMNIETSHLCEKRRAARIKLIQKPRSEIHQETYRKLNKEVKKAVKRIKVENLQKKVLSLEEDFKTNNSIIFNLFKTERELEGRQRKSLTMVKDRQGKKHSKLHEVMVCWEEHFKMHLNTGIPHDPDAILQIPNPPTCDDQEDYPTTDEIYVKSMKRGKAPGIDEITTETIETAGEPMVKMLEKISKKVWHEEKSPKDWSRMLVSHVHKKGDKLDPANYRAIALLSIPGKVFLRVLLNARGHALKKRQKNHNMVSVLDKEQWTLFL